MMADSNPVGPPPQIKTSTISSGVGADEADSLVAGVLTGNGAKALTAAGSASRQQPKHTDGST
jgi:hypothetical protein